MFRQALFDIHTLQCVPVVMQSPEVVQSPAVVQSPEICLLEALGVVPDSSDGVAKPAGPTDRGEAFSFHSVAYSPDVVQSSDGGLQSRLVSVSFDPGVQNEELQDEELQDEDLQSEEVLNEKLHYSQHIVFVDASSEVCHAPFPDTLSAFVDPGVRKEELHDEELQDVGLQNEELLNEQLHYSHHTYYTASRPEVCHSSASDGDSACHGKDWQGDLRDFKDEEEDNVHVDSVESSMAVAAEEASLASQSNDAVLHSAPLDYSLHSSPLDYSLH
ncbi:unnamed protein product [Prorocentrum cordatum]|uniref:Uncharacterized protein n=1 Tax=Prorocentrum cordatum TaxID=2364126 RepID=A0ABN9S7J8_9DINO|nr:unnamed protein product [Polarella glacialis]